MRVLADGRVRRTRAEWQAIMKRFRKSDLSVARFCQREKISASAFADWRRKLEITVAGKVKVVRKPRFVEVAPPPPSKPSKPSTPEAAREFELSLPGDVVLRWKA